VELLPFKFGRWLSGAPYPTSASRLSPNDKPRCL